MSFLKNWLSWGSPPPSETPTRAAEARSSLSGWRYLTHEPLKVDGATEKLRKDELAPEVFKGIKTFVCRVPSQSPVEDRYSYGNIAVGGSQQWPFWAVFDGHSLVFPHPLTPLGTMIITCDDPEAGPPQNCSAECWLRMFRRRSGKQMAQF